MQTRSKTRQIERWLEHERDCEKRRVDTVEGDENPEIRKDLIVRRFGETGYCLRHALFHCGDCRGLFAPGPDYNATLFSISQRGKRKLGRPDLHRRINIPTKTIYYCDGLVIDSLKDWGD